MATIKVKRRHTTGGTASTVDGELSVNSFDKKIFIGNGSTAVEIANQLGYSTIATVGTITTGTWNGTAIGAIYGGTGQTTYAAGDLLYSSAANTLSKLAKPSVTSFLQMTSAGVPSWTDTITTTSINGNVLYINDNAANDTVIGNYTGVTNNIDINNSLGYIGITSLSGGGVFIDSSSTVNIGDISNLGEYIIIDPTNFSITTGSLEITTPALISNTTTHSESGTGVSRSGVVTLTTTSTTQVNLLQLNRNTIRSAKFLIQAVNTTGGKYQITEINAIHNGGTTVASATISDINTGGSNATYAVDAVSSVGGLFRLRVTPSSTQSTTFKVFYTAILL